MIPYLRNLGKARDVSNATALKGKLLVAFGQPISVERPLFFPSVFSTRRRETR